MNTDNTNTNTTENGLRVILCGFSAAEKTTLYRELARETGAVHIRIDSIEDALRHVVTGDMADAEYRVGYAVAGVRAVEVEARRGGRRLRVDEVVAIETDGRAVAERVAELRERIGV